MARAVNQTIAWFSFFFLSAVVFAGGYGVFSYMRSSGHSAKNHGGDHHAAGSHPENGPKHGEQGSEKNGAHADSDGHTVGDEKKQSSHAAEADAKQKHSEDKQHGEKDKANHDHDRDAEHKGEEEISADQFKGKSEHH